MVVKARIELYDDCCKTSWFMKERLSLAGSVLFSLLLISMTRHISYDMIHISDIIQIYSTEKLPENYYFPIFKPLFSTLTTLWEQAKQL